MLGGGELHDGNSSELLEGVCGPKPLASAKMVVDVRFEGLQALMRWWFGEEGGWQCVPGVDDVVWKGAS